MKKNNVVIPEQKNLPLEALKADIKEATAELKKSAEDYLQTKKFETNIIDLKRKATFEELLKMSEKSLQELRDMCSPLLVYAFRVPNKKLGDGTKPNDWVRPTAIKVLGKITEAGIIDMGFWIWMSDHTPKRLLAKLIDSPDILTTLNENCAQIVLPKPLQKQLKEEEKILKQAIETGDERQKLKSTDRVKLLKKLLAKLE